MKWLMIAATIMVATPVSAGSMELALQLGSVLASEEPCSLDYDQSAIEAFIEKRVKPDDLDFPSTLSMMTDGQAFQIKGMSKSALTAHCAQIRRLAKSYKFIP